MQFTEISLTDNMASSDGTVDGVDFIEKITHSLEYTRVEACFLKWW